KDYEVEGFDLYSPLAMANIWGMDDTVKDRCIVIQLDKSDNSTISRLLEDFENDIDIQNIRKVLLSTSISVDKKNQKMGLLGLIEPKFGILDVDNVDVDRKKSLLCLWNEYIYTNTLPTLYTLPTLSTLFPKIKEAGVYGRDLELFFPLFILANLFGEDILKQTIDYSKQKFAE